MSEILRPNYGEKHIFYNKTITNGRLYFLFVTCLGRRQKPVLDTACCSKGMGYFYARVGILWEMKERLPAGRIW